MGRIGYFVKDATNPEQRSELAHSLMYLTRGPAGRLLRRRAGLRRATAPRRADKDARQSLFATQVAEYANQNLLDGTLAGSVDRYDTDTALYDHIAELAALRRAPGAASTVPRSSGTPTARSTRSRRVDADEKVEHLVATNNGTDPGDGHDRHPDAGRDVRAAVRDVDERDGGRRRDRRR